MKTSNVSSLIRHSNVSLSLRSCCVWSNLSLPCRSNLLSERSHIPSISTAVSKELSFAAKTMRCGVVSSAMAESTDTTESVDTEYEAVIGIECHVQLNTLTKAFCSCLNKFGMEPNSNICPVCLGHPGTLPVINEQVVRKGILAGLALNCSIALASKFDRKQYFYADLPKGYQISQYDEPLCYDGWIQVPLPENDSEKRIRIERAHLEEDAGKLVYSDRLSGSTFSLVDYNRAGVPLLEIVSGPDMRNGKEAAAYASELRRIMRFLNVSDGNMQEGSMRCDVNISVRKKEAETFGTKVEIKNMNSFNAMQRAIDFEFQRQVTLLKTGQGDKIIQETRLWNEDQQITESMRKKEGLADYRYFPEPDLPPLELKPEMIDELKQTMPELPASKRARYTSMGLSEYDAAVLSDELDVSIFYDAVIAAGAAPKLAANWVMGDIMAYCKEERLAMGDLPMQPKTLAEMIKLIENSTISGKIGKEILPALLDGEAEVDGVAKYIEDKGLIQISDVSALTEIVAKVLADNPKQLEQYRSGKTKLQGFFVGQAMKESKGRANPAELNKILMKKLNEA